jgi:seryl-tRNA synthetase
MEFQLRANLKCSSNLAQTGIVDEVAEFVDISNKVLLKKGAPPNGGAEIVWWDVVEDKINLRIVSDRFVRAHDAVLRLRNELQKILGRHRIGIRSIEIEEYVLIMKMETEAKTGSESGFGLGLKKLPFVREIKREKGLLKLYFDVNEEDIKKRIPDRIIRLLEEKREAAKWKGKAEHWELLWESKKKTSYFDKDPAEDMIKKGWIRHASGRGQWIYGPQITSIFRAFEKILLDYVCYPLGYVEMIFPKVVTWDVWKRSGHAKGIYPEAYYVCTPKTRDPGFWEDIMDYYKITGEVPLEEIMPRIENIGGLCYAQCPPFWVFLQGKTIADDDEMLPIKVFDRSGTSHRYESGGVHGIERVDEFHRVELVWIGKKEQVIEHSKVLQEKYRLIFDKILDLEWREAWVTPWFMAQEGMHGLSEAKEVGTVDYEAVLPYNNKWLEFQNLSVNGNKYPKGFSVKLQGKEELWSGCSGVGLERWAAVFLAQKGLEPDKWTSKFKSVVGELPEVFRFV